MMNNPLISVGIPTYNRPSGLRRVLENICAQTYENLEIIISDNCSDNKDVKKIVREFIKNDKRIRYYCHECNMGPVYNFNFALRKARGDYFMWAADDDEWPQKNYILKCFEFLRDNSDYSLVCGEVKYYNNKIYFGEGVKINLTSANRFERVADYYSQVMDNSTFYGLYDLKKIENFYLKNNLGGDWFFIAAAAFKGKIGFLPDIYFIRNCGGATVSFEKITATLNLDSINSKYPNLMIAFNALCDIMFSAEIYKAISIFERMYFSSIIFWKIFYARAFMPWFLKRPSFIINTAVTAKKIIKNIVCFKIFKH